MQITLHPKQQLALESRATEILYGGAAGGGKSFLMRVIAIMYCMSVPGIQVYILRRKSDDLKKNHLYGEAGLQALCKAIPGCRVNEQTGKVSFPNGAMIHLEHCQHEKNKLDFQGAEIHVLLIDELTHFTESIYRYLRSRTRRGENLQTDLLLPRIICGANPGGVGHNWVRRTFVKSRDPMQIERMPQDDGGMLRQYIPARLSDNPSINAEEYTGNLAGMGDPALVRAMLDGDWDIVAGGIIDDLWNVKTEHHFILKPFAIPKSWTVRRTLDWGSSKPFSVGWWAEANGEQVTLADGNKRTFYPGSKIRVHEWYGCRKGENNVGLKLVDRELARGIRKIERSFKFHVKPGAADSSIFDVVPGRTTSIADSMRREGITWLEADKKPGSRVNGAERIRAMLSASQSYPMEEPGVFLFDTCSASRELMPIMPRDEKKPDDVNTESEDHIWDEWRYALTAPRRGMSVGDTKAA